ncbi:PAS domain S-box protein [Candidatus Magnetobacterium casense]|uniref:histidine kinase n=1 Tax=Candidatus Magnetobacterium casense TaxID=1455061 RepID=A0ABS6RX49_9BACT|nr:PAS domain S-box protein [Candidatus Magnetobacterium casensis]MBV6341202.1 PAS domain S-box protein [Candidatus Magnetobacterium casensis]
MSFVDNIRQILKDRVESNINSLFEANIALRQHIYQRTKELDKVNKELQEEIKERKQIEEALRLSENRYKRLVDAITDYMYTVEVKDGRAVSTRHSAGCVAVTGYHSEEYESDQYLWYRMIAEDDREMVKSQVKHVLAGEAAPPIEHRIIHKNGSVRWVRNTIVPRRNQDGRLIAYDGLISDITQRKLAEEALKLSENRYKRLLGATTDYIYTVEVKDGRAASTTHGPGCVAVTGYTTEEYDEEPYLWYRMIHGEDRKAVTELAYKILKGEPVLSIEHRIIHKDTSIRWVRNTPVARYDSNRNLIAYDGLISDITEKKLAEEQLRKNTEQLQDFFDNASDMIHVVTPDGRFKYVNRSWLNTLDYSEDEVETLTLSDVIHPDHFDNGLHNFNCFLIGSISSRFETVFVTRDGRNIVVLGSVNCIFENGIPSVTRGIFHDITDIKRAEEALKKYNDELEIRVRERTAELLHAKTYLESVLLSLTDALIVVNGDLVIQTVNHSACTLLGYDEDQLVGKMVDVMFAENVLEAIGGHGNTKDLFTSMKTATSGDIPVLVNLSRLGQWSEEVINDTIVVAHDMREIRKLEEESHRIQLKMLTSSKMATLGEIATGIAHEINQPLTYISSFLQGLILEIKQGALNTDALKKEAVVAYKQVNRIVDIIQHLRTFGRRDDIEMESISIEMVLHNSLLLMGERIRLRNISLTKNVEPNLPSVVGSANQLEQVFINLLQNAMDALAQNKTAAEIRIVIRLSRDKQFIVIKFTDNGMGIEEKILDRIFEPFYTTKEVGMGTGLGLSIVYGIIVGHNGTITCDSKANRGTTFTINLPVAGSTTDA